MFIFQLWHLATGMSGRGDGAVRKDAESFSVVAERMQAWEATYDQSLQYIESNAGQLNVHDASQEDPRLTLMDAVEEDVRDMDQLLTPSICEGMGAVQAWSVVEFLKSVRGYMDDARGYMLGEPELLKAAAGTERRFAEVEEEILRKMIKPFSQEISQAQFYNEMQRRNLPFPMREKLQNLFEMYAFIGAHLVQHNKL